MGVFMRPLKRDGVVNMYPYGAFLKKSHKSFGLKGVTAAERWRRDELRLTEFTNKTGVVPLVVWEHDYRLNPEGVLNQIGELYARNN